MEEVGPSDDSYLRQMPFISNEACKEIPMEWIDKEATIDSKHIPADLLADKTRQWSAHINEFQ